jgi:hypothetical protein
MNNFIKQVIEEKFASKSQQRFFYAKANEKGSSKKEKKKWGKWAKEFSDKTNYDEIPDKVEKKEKNQTELQFDEIVDGKGNIMRSKKPTNFNSKGVTQKKTSDEVVHNAAGAMGIHGVHGTHTSLRYWAESNQLTKSKILEIAMKDALGYEETLGKDKDKEEAEDYFKNELGLNDKEAEERLNKMGYDEKLPDDKVRLVENPKKFIEEFIESILSQKSKDSDFVTKNDEITEVDPIIKKQIKSLKNSLKSHNLTINDVISHLKDNE